MKTDVGGISKSASMQTALRWLTLSTPIFIGVYLFLGSRGLFGVSLGYDVPLLFTDILNIIWVVSGVIMYLIFTPTLRNAALRLIFFHILGGVFVVLFIGVSFPLTSLWVLMVLSNYAYFGLRSGVASLVVLAVCTVADSLLHPGTLATNLAMFVSVTIVSTMMLAFFRAQERDEQEFKKIQEDEVLQRESLTSLVNNMANAVISTDKSGAIRVYNASTLGLLDTNTAITGKNIDDIVTLYDQDGEVVRFIDILKQSSGVTMVDTLKTIVDDEDVRLELTYSPIRGDKPGDHSGYVIIMRDVTRMKSLEEERDEFISVVSHELRTPIAIAEGNISNAQLMFDRDDIHDDLLKKGLETAHEQVVFLAKMINDLSTLSRAERGVADAPEDIDVRELADGLFNEYAPEAKKKDLQLNLDLAGTLGTVSVSRLYLHELLQNFITNAIKYTKEGSITLSVARKKDQVVFTVKDSGIGISKADQAKIFKKFYRSEDYRTRETSGTGLGLYVATKLAKKIGCSIELQSRLNHGSSFSFSLPVKRGT